MLIKIICIGRSKSGPETTIVDQYLDRLKKSARSLGVSGVEILALSESRAKNAVVRKAEEAENLLGKVGSFDFLIALDEAGEDMRSDEFSKILRRCLDIGTRTFVIVIGGPDGHGQDIINRADRVIRFGKMTWPHQIIRIMATEQLYRATTILNGHPYHRN